MLLLLKWLEKCTQKEATVTTKSTAPLLWAVAA